MRTTKTVKINMSICDSSSSTTVTDSTNSSNTSLTTGFISIPNTDSSLEDFNLQQRRPEKLRQHYRGQLRMDVNIIGNYLFTHIIAARNLGAKLNSKPSSFVEITIIPESRVHSKCMSTIYRSSHRPVFDEKVSMELPINFKSKRLLVTVYHDRQFNKNHQILGCMSFGLHRISRGSPCQLACGWFYLLDEDIGKRRHVKVINNAINVKSYSSSANVSKLLLCRTTDGGFGFSVIGSCPVRICRVKKGSTAEMHNLQQDDAIVMIDSRDVSRCTSMEVSSIIRSTKHFMTVAIQRGPHYTCDKNEDKVKNGMVAKLIKKIFFNGNQHKSATTTTTTSSDVLVDYGWLENDGQHSRERPPVPLNGARDFRKVFQQSVQKDSNSRGWPHLTSKGQKNVAIDYRGIRVARQDGIESDPGTPDQRWHSKREMSGRLRDDDDDDDDSDGSDYDDLQSSNLGRMSKMLSPVAECDSHLQTDSQFLGSHDDTYEDESRDDSQNNASVVGAAAINNDELLCDEFMQSIYNDNNKNVNRSLTSDNGLMTDDYDENGYLDDNDSNYDEGNLDPRELSHGGSCQSYLRENHDLDQKENLFQNGPTKSRRTDYTSHSRLSLRRNHPLTSRENFSPNFQETPDSLRNRDVNDDSDAISNILNTPSAPQKSRKGKAVVSKIKTIFKNRHAS